MTGLAEELLKIRVYCHKEIQKCLFQSVNSQLCCVEKEAPSLASLSKRIESNVLP